MKAPRSNLILYIIDILAKIGNSSTISTSKIRNTMARRKNRSENGNRADLIGSNPHSNGDLFSRSLFVRFDSTHPKNITIKDKIKAANLLNVLLII